MRRAFFLIFILLIASENVYSSVKSDISKALKYYESGKCADALPILDNLLNSNDITITENPELEYRLSYYAAYCAKETENYDKAELYFSKAAEKAKEMNITGQLPVIYSFLGNLAHDRKDYQAAVAYYDSAVIFLHNDNQTSFDDSGRVSLQEEAALRYLMAKSYKETGNFSRAIENLNKGLELSKQTDDEKLFAACLVLMGEIYYYDKNYTEAVRQLNHGLIAARNAKMPLEMAQSHLGLGYIYEKLSRYDLARQNMDEAFRFYSISGRYDEAYNVVMEILNIPSAPLTAFQSEKYIKNYTEIYNKYIPKGSAKIDAAFFTLLGRYYALSDDRGKALNSYEKALNLWMKNGCDEEAADTALICADIYIKDLDRNKARKILLRTQEYLSGRNATLSQKINEYIASHSLDS